MSERTIILILHVCIYAATAYNVRISNDGPIVKGGTIHFHVVVYDGSTTSIEKFKYEWEDNAIPQHTRESDIQGSNDSWAVSYDAIKYPLGIYRAQVKVKSCVLSIICYEIGSARTDFNITGTLNGGIRLSQQNKTRENDFVSNKETVIHEVVLKKSDADYISKAPTIRTYWFVDCVYYGFSMDFKFPFNYTQPDEEHLLEALVLADFTPLPPPPTTTTVAPTTTTIKPTSIPTTSAPTTTSTTTTTTTTTPTTTTTYKPNNVTAATTAAPNATAAVTKTVVKRNVIYTTPSTRNGNVSMIMANVNGKLVPSNLTLPFICNGSHVMTDWKKSYGYFYKKVDVKAPISSVNVTGNNWIQQGDLLSLQVSCRGSKNIQYCVELLRGAHNVTGNETCYNYKELDTCDFPIKRYLAGNKYTIVIIIENEVGKIVTPVVVTMYEVKKQAQLSVIVVPVAFSLVAVVLIVFGVAYYIQNRSRFIIEVADFNFGQQYSDMEYKTFKERLKDSIMNAFTRGPTPSSSEVPVWPPGRKYGSMT